MMGHAQFHDLGELAERFRKRRQVDPGERPEGADGQSHEERRRTRVHVVIDEQLGQQREVANAVGKVHDFLDVPDPSPGAWNEHAATQKDPATTSTYSVVRRARLLMVLGSEVRPL